LRVGAIAGTLDASLDTEPPELAPAVGRIKQGAFTSRLIFDQVDSAIFPRSGAAGSAHVFASSDALGADATYTKWDADGIAAWSFGDHTCSRSFMPGFRWRRGNMARHSFRVHLRAR
jgi:NTE family protein